MAIAALWSFAEATVFIIVADVWLTWLAVTRGTLPALKASLAAAIAAAAGGVAVWWAASADPAAVRSAIDSLPDVSPDLLAEAARVMGQPDWVRGMVEGSFTGVPYKAFATEAGAQGVPLALFAAMSVPVRLLRFTLAVLGTSLVMLLLDKAGRARWARPLWAIFWIGFYAVYWFILP